jgi:hypothetical protein
MLQDAHLHSSLSSGATSSWQESWSAADVTPIPPAAAAALVQLAELWLPLKLPLTWRLQLEPGVDWCFLLVWPGGLAREPAGAGAKGLQ